MAGERLIWAGHPTWRATISSIVWGILGAIVVFVLGILLDAPFYGFLGLVAIAGGTIVYSWVKRRFTEYTITDKRLNVRWGILSKQETTTTVDRIQNLTITQTPVDRILGTGTIDFDTASPTSDERFRFSAIDKPRELRQQINELRAGDAPGAETAGL